MEMIQRDKSKRKRQRKYRLKVAIFLLQENKTFFGLFPGFSKIELEKSLHRIASTYLFITPLKSSDFKS